MDTRWSPIPITLVDKRFKHISQTNKLSQPALETLAIIAYKQPVTKLEVDQLRGVNSDGAIKSLLDKHLIKIIGKKETPGQAFSIRDDKRVPAVLWPQEFK